MNKVIYERWGTAVHVARRDELAFAPHMHDEVELVYIKNGPVTAYVDDKEYTLKDGSLLVIFPDQLHSYVDCVIEKELVNYIMIFKSSVLKIFSAEFDNVIPENPLILDKEILDEIVPLFDEACKINEKEPEYLAQALNAYAMLILQKALPALTYKKARNVSKDVAADIFAYCNKNFCEDISLESISKEISISKEHIMRVFREKFHTNFRSYINHMRINKAVNLLQTTDKSVTEISIAVGYNTIRTFNREFFTITGKTPSEYRK